MPELHWPGDRWGTGTPSARRGGCRTGCCSRFPLSLSEDGSIRVSIDDNEGHYLKVLMDEVFGRRNFIANVIWQKKSHRTTLKVWVAASAGKCRFAMLTDAKTAGVSVTDQLRDALK